LGFFASVTVAETTSRFVASFGAAATAAATASLSSSNTHGRLGLFLGLPNVQSFFSSAVATGPAAPCDCNNGTGQVRERGGQPAKDWWEKKLTLVAGRLGGVCAGA
jgi:hypothetical protein